MVQSFPFHFYEIKIIFIDFKQVFKGKFYK